MSHEEAEAFVNQVDGVGFVDSWHADALYSFVIHSQDATQWNSIGQFIQIQRLRSRRLLSLIVDEKVEASQEDVPIATETTPKGTSQHPATSSRTSYVLLILQGILGSVFRTELKRTAKRALWALFQSTLAYFGDLRGKPHLSLRDWLHIDLHNLPDTSASL